MLENLSSFYTLNCCNLRFSFLAAPHRRRAAAPKPDAAFLAEVRTRRLKELEMHRVLRQIAAYSVFLAFTLFLAHHSIDKRAIYIKNDLLATLFHTKPYFRKVSLLISWLTIPFSLKTASFPASMKYIVACCATEFCAFN